MTTITENACLRTPIAHPHLTVEWAEYSNEHQPDDDQSDDEGWIGYLVVQATDPSGQVHRLCLKIPHAADVTFAGSTQFNTEDF